MATLPVCGDGDADPVIGSTEVHQENPAFREWVIMKPIAGAETTQYRNQTTICDILTSAACYNQPILRTIS